MDSIRDILDNRIDTMYRSREISLDCKFLLLEIVRNHKLVVVNGYTQTTYFPYHKVSHGEFIHAFISLFQYSHKIKQQTERLSLFREEVIIHGRS